MVHGRGASAGDILALSGYLNISGFALIAPQAVNGSWYPFSFLMPPERNEPGLSESLMLLGEIEKDINKKGILSDKIYFLGFSQGCCLVLEYVTRNAKKYGGIAGFTGGLIGDKIYADSYKGDFGRTPVFIGTSDPDPHVPPERVEDTSRIMEKMNAEVSLKIYKDMGHTINRDEIDTVNKLIFPR